MERKLSTTQPALSWETTAQAASRSSPQCCPRRNPHVCGRHCGDRMVFLGVSHHGESGRVRPPVLLAAYSTWDDPPTKEMPVSLETWSQLIIYHPKNNPSPSQTRIKKQMLATKKQVSQRKTDLYSFLLTWASVIFFEQRDVHVYQHDWDLNA